MIKSEIFSALECFIKPHPFLHPRGEKIFVPRENDKIRLWFEGNLQIEGDENTLEINFNSDKYFILVVKRQGSNHIYRIAWKSLIACELITKNEPDTTSFPQMYSN